MYTRPTGDVSKRTVLTPGASGMIDQIRQFIQENFLFGSPDASLNDDDSFHESGIIDSTGILELVSFVEETFGIHVNDEDLIPENFDSVNKVTNYIRRKLPAEQRVAP
jgi:acyl carrier protein